eukprot:CAMPEP_0170621258 /NCGR_PEP_ID=MMETSP0224-20130122/28507_1 /TAXON_ID=285029 /ORGANISM="Togula jolla, Strain CCCM 725" /LENGTH=291 /DNA_ID=CAMNT_0010947509 /DNA_START=18 /DNA_END=893 /DNA_ORIENTATION=+
MASALQLFVTSCSLTGGLWLGFVLPAAAAICWRTAPRSPQVFFETTTEVHQYKMDKKCAGEPYLGVSEVTRDICKETCLADPHCNFVNFENATCARFSTCDLLADDPGGFVLYKIEVALLNPTRAPAAVVPGMEEFLINMKCATGQPKFGDLGNALSPFECQEECKISTRCSFAYYTAAGQCTSFEKCNRVRERRETIIWKKVASSTWSTTASASTTTAEASMLMTAGQEADHAALREETTAVIAMAAATTESMATLPVSTTLAEASMEATAGQEAGHAAPEEDSSCHCSD